MYCEAGKPLLSLRRPTLFSNLATEILKNPFHPTYHTLHDKLSKLTFSNNKYTKFLISLFLKNNGISTNFLSLTPIFTYPPPWILKHPTILLNLTSHNKSNTNKSTIHTQLSEVLSRNPESWKCFIDETASLSPAWLVLSPLTVLLTAIN